MPALNSLYSSLCFMVKDNLADPKHFTNNSQLRCNCGGGGGGGGSKSASGSRTKGPIPLVHWTYYLKPPSRFVFFVFLAYQLFCFFEISNLRTVPTIVIAHTFCSSPDTRISYRRCLLIQGYFCAV